MALDSAGHAVAWLHRSAATPDTPPPSRSTPNFRKPTSTVGVWSICPIRSAISAAISRRRRRIAASAGSDRSRICRITLRRSHLSSELAAAAKRDPKEFLLELLGPPRRVDPRSISDTRQLHESPVKYPIDIGRYREVIEVAAREAGWGRALPKGHGLGIAATYSFMSYAAAVVEVAVDAKGRLSIPRIDCRFRLRAA